MPVRVKIDPIDRDLTLFVDGRLSPAARAKAQADYARSVLADAQRRNRTADGQAPRHATFVDRRAEAPLESVSANGNITFEFDLVAPMLTWVHQRLRANSPVKTGRYRDSHVLFADGVEIDPGAAPPVADQFVFTTPLPYARKVEIGNAKVNLPGSGAVYQGVAALAARRFGNIARITFSYRAVEGNSIMQISRVGPLQVKRNRRGRFVKGSHVRAGNQAERALRNPAIVITMRG